MCRVCVTTQAVQGFSQAQGGVDDQTASDRAMPHVGFFEFVDAGLGDGGNAGIELGTGSDAMFDGTPMDEQQASSSLLFF